MKWPLVFMGAALTAALTWGQSAQAQTEGQFVRAIKQDNPSALQELLAEGFDPNTKDEHGQPGIVMALHEDSYRAAKALAASPKLKIDETDANGQNALMMAAWAGQLDIAKELVAKGAAVNKAGWTPLHYAASKATDGEVAMIRYLLLLGADINAGSPNGTTPLMMAAAYGSPDAVKLLIDSDADIGKRNQQDMTALDFAKRYERPDAIKMLTQAGQVKAAKRSGSSSSETPPAVKLAAPVASAAGGVK
ncbi:MAG: ankyrin repeat domain-containing protein [Burkholderiaceae bacterium]|jgi:ankyrin repeat protein|nr:ankyrin repeat domain-containing protein [Burkholderiaceae bacterium]